MARQTQTFSAEPDPFNTLPDSERWKDSFSVDGSAFAEAEQALDCLARSHWLSLYGYLRRRGYGREDAEDLVQGFFLHLLEAGSFKMAFQDERCLRNFLLACLRNFVAGQNRVSGRLKRGGGSRAIPLELLNAEDRLQLELGLETSPDTALDRERAILLANNVLGRLETEAVGPGKLTIFKHLLGALTGAEEALRYRELAARTGMTEAAVKMAVLRLRQRYRELFVQEVAQSVRHPNDVTGEVHFLFTILSQ